MKNLKALTINHKQYDTGMCLFILFSLLLLASLGIMGVYIAIPAFSMTFLQKPPSNDLFWAWMVAFRFLGRFFLLFMALLYMYKKKGVLFRFYYNFLLITGMPLAAIFLNGDAPFLQSLLLVAAILTGLYLLSRYVKKSKALKAYFGEE